jgi:uncharacterized SAM-binding protein YcdF (DUF218 family)
MFFVASKVLTMAFLPLNALFALAVAGWLAWRFNRKRVASRLGIAAALAFIAIGFTQLPDLAIDWLERRVPPGSIEGDIAGIIVLGGGLDGDGPPEEPVRITEGGSRLIRGLALARQLPGARLIYAGGVASLDGEGHPEALGAAEIVAMLGIDYVRVESETESRNTAENAAAVAGMLGADSDRAWLLVTSGFHMPRALGCFRKAGVNVIAAPADYRANGLEPPFLAADSARQFHKFGTALKEIAGLIVYRLTGRTDALLPR